VVKNEKFLFNSHQIFITELVGRVQPKQAKAINILCTDISFIKLMSGWCDIWKRESRGGKVSAGPAEYNFRQRTQNSDYRRSRRQVDECGAIF
jgi:hypothetical protein